MSERYQIHERVGQGGRGSVYRAVDSKLKREVAVKRIAVPDGASPEEIEKIGDKLMREAMSMSALNHPNIVSIYDVQRDEEGGFVVMELINGDTLHDVVKRNPLTLEDFREVAQQTLEALIAANEANMLHRDIKPGNIMLMWLPSHKFQVKVLDFGLAKISEQPSLQTVDHGKSIVGSIHFMAPEQFELRELDATTDLYALGCVFYFCLTGKYPFDGDSMAKIMTAHLAGSYEPLDKLRPDLPGDLCQWVMWLMNRDMERRPHSAREALELIPLAESPTGNVFVVTPIHPIPPSSPLPAAPSTSPTPKLNTGRIPPVTGRITLTTGRIPPVTGRVALTTGRIPPVTGRVALTTGRVPLTTAVSGQTGRVRLPMPVPEAATEPVGAPRPQIPPRPGPPWIAIAAVITVVGMAALGIYMLAATRGPQIRPERFAVRDDFTVSQEGLKNRAPLVLAPALQGRIWVTTPGVHLTPAGLAPIKQGFQTVALDISGAFTTRDTIRILARGVVNPTDRFIAIGFAEKSSNLTLQDMLAWVKVFGDNNPTKTAAEVNQIFYQGKKLHAPLGGWNKGAANDFELILNCRRGEAAFYLNGQKKGSGNIFKDGMARVPSHLVLVFDHPHSGSIREVAMESLGLTEIADVVPLSGRPQDKL